jgi:hypothetical protein
VYKDGSEPVILDSLRYGSLGSDESFGRTPDGGEDLGNFANPTPAYPNFRGSNTHFHETAPAPDSILSFAGQSQTTVAFYWTRPVLSETSLSGITYTISLRNLRTGIDNTYSTNADESHAMTFTQDEYGEYRWHVLAALADGRRLLTESRGFTLSTVSGVKTKDRIPDQFALSAPYPNPFNPSVTIEFALPVQSDVQLVVYDILGRRVRSLVGNRLTAGNHRVLWDGRNDDSLEASSGVYFVTIRTKNFIATRKMLFIQ